MSNFRYHLLYWWRRLTFRSYWQFINPGAPYTLRDPYMSEFYSYDVAAYLCRTRPQSYIIYNPNAIQKHPVTEVRLGP